MRSGDVRPGAAVSMRAAAPHSEDWMQTSVKLLRLFLEGACILWLLNYAIRRCLRYRLVIYWRKAGRQAEQHSLKASVRGLEPEGDKQT